MVTPPKPRPGDRVAILSPSSAGPERFPLPYEQGLRRLREEFGLVPVEYPTTRRQGTPEQRAMDLHAAFADPEIKAVVTTIGGEDQIRVLRHLDPDVLRANPKPFFGYSDNTNLLNYLFTCGIVGYHGGCVMVQFGRGGRMTPATADSLRAALFTTGPYELRESPWYTDVDRDWADPATVAGEPEQVATRPWDWVNADRVVEGRLWGGNLEILGWTLAVGTHVRPATGYAGHVLFVETSEEMPSATEVYRMLRCMGERDLLGQLAAVLVARPKAWFFTKPDEVDYAERQRAAVQRALDEYAPGVPTVYDVDFGHTDPQLVLPYGGEVRLDGPARRITVTY